MSKPREFWISDCILDGFVYSDKPESLESIHVIEKSAFDSLSTQNEINRMAAENGNRRVIELESRVVSLVEINDLLKAENQKYRMEMDKITKGIPSEWAYAILQKERDELKAENEQLNFEVQSLTTDHNELKAENERLKSGIETGSWEAEMFMEEMNKLKDENERLKTKCEKLKMEHVKLQQKFIPTSGA